MTPHEFALANGWDFDAIEATAARGVAPDDLERLEDAGLTAETLLAWCRERVRADAVDARALRISYTIYSAHLTDDTISDDKRRDVAEAYADSLRKRLAAEYPNATREIRVVHGVQGVGAGLDVTDDAGNAISRLAEEQVGSVIDSVETPWPVEHETPEEWYYNYGRHITTERAGDVYIQAVTYDWLDDDDNGAVGAKLLRSDPRLQPREAIALVALARGVREAAEEVCGLLDDAANAFQARDFDGMLEALEAASCAELEHGDDPAASELKTRLLRAYAATDGPDAARARALLDEG